MSSSGQTTGTAGLPLAVAVGGSSGNGQQGSLLAVNAPANISGTAPTTPNVPGGTTGSSSGPLVALDAPATVGSTQATVPVSAVSGTSSLVGPTAGPGTLVSVTVPVSATGPTATGAAA